MRTILISLGFLIGAELWACTNIIVTPGASTDGSTMIAYTCDGEFHPRLQCWPAKDHEPGAMQEITDWYGEKHGEITEVRHTHAGVCMMNEHQLAIAETTFDGRLELQNPNGLMHYWKLMQLALERATTAREAIEVITSLVDTYGYRSTGETFSIGDPNEAWIMEMIGPGPDGHGAIWVAVRVPDGHVAVHANKARIGTFPLNDPDRCLYSPNVISFAVEKGYVISEKDFRFDEAYCPSTPKNCRYADTRVWSLFRRLAPSREWPADRHRGVPDAEPYPLWIKPETQVGVADVMSLLRDHYENTPFDMTCGVDAGPHGTPNRWRPIHWEIEGREYAWERPISTQQTGFSFVTQSRRNMPDAVGGLTWYGVDDTYTTCYIPLYCSIDRIPPSFGRGSLQQFSWDSAWWVFNFVANFANVRYDLMIKDILAVQADLESTMLAMQPAIEQTAVHLMKTDPELATTFLTDYCEMQGEKVTRRWTELAEYLVCKYNDGYVKDEDGRPQEQGYTPEWLQRVINERPKQFLLPERDEDTPETRLID